MRPGIKSKKLRINRRGRRAGLRFGKFIKSIFDFPNLKVEHTFDGETLTTTYSIEIAVAVMPIKNVEIPITFVADIEHPKNLNI